MYQVERKWHLLLITCICTYTIFATLSMSSKGRIVMELIHRDSIFSPYYSQNHTVYDRSEFARTSSMARYAFLSSRERNVSSLVSSAVMRDYQAEMSPEYSGTLFMARISFGNPPVPQLVAMDTGSGLLWIQCLPCEECFDQLGQIFNPSKSSTYINIPCQFPECTSYSSHSCDRMNKCHYAISYSDGTHSNGPLIFEQLTIGTSDEGLIKIPNVVIGCGTENTITVQLQDGQKGHFSGILGLGPQSESIVHKLGNKFSYCVGNINDVSYPFNQLAFGEAARLDGYSTPMYRGSQSYLVTVEGISVGDKRLERVTRETFQSGQWVRAGVMIDSGTTYTYLATQGYLALKHEVAALMDGLIEQRPFGRHDLECYKGDMKRDLKGFPVITYHLAEGADLVVDIDGLFRQINSNTFCLAVLEASGGEGAVSILGIQAQQYYNVGYDLDDERIYFQRIDCQVLVS